VDAAIEVLARLGDRRAASRLQLTLRKPRARHPVSCPLYLDDGGLDASRARDVYTGSTLSPPPR